MSTPTEEVTAKIFASINSMIAGLLKQKAEHAAAMDAIEAQQDALLAVYEDRHAKIVQIDLQLEQLYLERKRYDGDPQT